MVIICRSPFQAEISLKDGVVHVIGSTYLVSKMNQLKKLHGASPLKWPELTEINSADDLLLQEFILKCLGKFSFVYEHSELCHCRMVPTEKVFEAIKQGCTSVEAIGKATLAGTGCGSCRPDIEKMLKQFLISSVQDQS